MMVEEQRLGSDGTKERVRREQRVRFPLILLHRENPDETISRQKSENRNLIPAEKNTPMAGICSGPLT